MQRAIQIEKHHATLGTFGQKTLLSVLFALCFLIVAINRGSGDAAIFNSSDYNAR